MDILIGSGWWSSLTDRRTYKFGDDSIRNVSFFDKWLSSLDAQDISADIFITDSASPVKPSQNKIIERQINFVTLNENGGHAIDHKGEWCGWTRSVIMSLTYCLCGSYDYYVYVEQDALLSGRVIKKAILEAQRTGAVFGESTDTPYKIQVSFFVLRRDAIKPFLKRIYQLDKLDKKIAPETKFMLALSSKSLWFARFFFLLNDRASRKLLKVFHGSKFFRKYDFLSFGFGRDRPIDFSQPEFYFQQATEFELSQYFKNEMKEDN